MRTQPHTDTRTLANAHGRAHLAGDMGGRDNGTLIVRVMVV